MIRHNIEIACRIGIFIVNCRWNPLPIQGKCAKRCLDGAGRTQWMRVIAFRSADCDSLCMFAKDLFDRRRFRAVVELCLAGVCVAVYVLLWRKLCFVDIFVYSTDAVSATW